MAKYCPYTNGNVVYLQCQECDRKICDPNTFFCLVIGSRSFHNEALLTQKLDYMLQNQKSVVIVSGGATGADKLAEEYAAKHDMPCLIFPADWKTHGKSAGYIRNEAMHQFLAKQQKRGVVAFWDGKSRGTQHSFDLAKQYHNQIRVIRTDHFTNNNLKESQ